MKIAVHVDIHGSIKATDKAVEYIAKHPVDIVVLPGDIPDCTKNNLVRILKKYLSLHIPIYFFPGSHENHDTVTSALKEIKNKDLHFIYDSSYKKKFGEHELIFIPGSDSVRGGSKSYNGGSYWQIRLGEKRRINRWSRRIRELKIAKRCTPIYLEKIFKAIKRSKATSSKRIVFTHIPLKCKTRKGIDVAHYGIPTDSFTFKKKDEKKHPELGFKGGKLYEPGGWLLTLDKALILKKLGYPVQTKKENVGSEDLRYILNQERITKFVCGHIHESGGRAIDKKENKVKQNTWSKELFLNAGPGTLRLAILELKKNKVKYSFKKL